MAEITVGYFLEDLAHAIFLKAVVERVAAEYTLCNQPMSSLLDHDSRNVTGGHGKALTELKEFLRDIRKGWVRPFDLLVVAIDSNCHSYTEQHNEIDDIVKSQQYLQSVAYAIPDPHIEKWYLMDIKALQQVLEQHVQTAVPQDKCEKNLYKNLLAKIFKDAGFDARMGGTEYGSEIVGALDFYVLTKADQAFGHFVDDLQSVFSVIERSRGSV